MVGAQIYDKPSVCLAWTFRLEVAMRCAASTIGMTAVHDDPRFVARIGRRFTTTRPVDCKSISRRNACEFELALQ